MENVDLQAVAESVLRRLFIELEASGRHVHVTKEQANILFGHELTPKRPLSQPGQFLARERVTLRGPKGEFQKVAVLGPERSEAQVEVSLTDGRSLGIVPPVRMSGSVAGSPGCTLVGEKGRVTIDHGVIAAQRHIHMTPEDAAQWGVTDGQIVMPLLIEADLVVKGKNEQNVESDIIILVPLCHGIEFFAEL